MDIKNLLFASVAFATLSVLATESVTVTGARQRWPWNGIVDIDFTLEGKATQLYRVEVSATSVGGKTRYRAATFLQEPVCQAGENRLSWNVGADFPGVRADDFAVTVEAYPADMADAYCVIDVSAGPEATKYPVRYTFRPPEHVRGATNEPCQLTEIWLKRIKRGVLPFGGTNSDGGEGDFKVKFSKDYYIGVFEITQRQWYQVMGTWPSGFSNPLYRDARPVEMVTHDTILGHHNWPDNKAVTDDSFVGRIRARTGLTTFNLPTDAQYEFAARAGLNKTSIRPTSAKTDAEFANFKRSSCKADVAATADTTQGTIPVGSLVPNDWGLYDVCGNVAEWVLDSFVSTTATSGNDLVHLYADEIAQNGYVLDPEGPPNNTSAPIHPTSVWRHPVRGGYYSNSDVAYLWPYQRRECYDPANNLGLRCVITCE